jgi:hypothetical protein
MKLEWERDEGRRDVLRLPLARIYDGGGGGCFPGTSSPIHHPPLTLVSCHCARSKAVGHNLLGK